MAKQSKLIATAAQACRVPIFAPTRKPREVIQQKMATSWGYATITGCLGQRHRDVLDLLGEAAEGGRDDGSRGDRTLLVDSAALRRLLGVNKYTYIQILALLRDLQAAEIELVVAGKTTQLGGLLTRIIESEQPPPERRGSRSGMVPTYRTPVAGGRPRGGMMWEITISGGWMRLVQQLRMTYPIGVMQLQYGVSQAVARFIMSHRRGEVRMNISTVLMAVGTESRRGSECVKKLDEDAHKIARLGVHLDMKGGTISCGITRWRAEPRTEPPETRKWPTETRKWPTETRSL